MHRVGLNGAGFRTTLFIDSQLVPLEQLAVTASFEFHGDAKSTMSVGAGAVLGGTLLYGDRSVHLSTGPTASYGYSRLLLEPNGAVPFVQLSGSISMSVSGSALGPYVALDFRGGVAAGWVLWDRVTGYATVRAFGGPVFWHDAVGTDRWHFQLGGGLVIGLPGNFDVSAEVIPLGEQSISAGVGYSF